jgi:uncharacterized damage-inducible protein DinB
MVPSQIRLRLLQQHDEIRAEMEALARAHSSSADLHELRNRTLHLAKTIRSHNRHEEVLLHVLLHEIDAWGPLHVGTMHEHHTAEHEQLLGALLDAATAIEAAAFEEIVFPAIDRVLDHMAREEKSFLNELILRDDVVVIDQSSG